MAEPIIEIRNASIFQRENLVLSNVNLTLNKGEFIYLIGRTGSGKSSLLKTLYGELPARDCPWRNGLERTCRNLKAHR